MIEFTTQLRLAPHAAFTLFTERISLWWPPTHRLTKDPNSQITLSADGTFVERATDGREMPLGHVVRWEPPHTLEFDFFMGTGPERPTRVLVTFTELDGGCLVRVVHQPTEASRDLWDSTVSRYTTSWPAVLAAFQRAI